LTARDSNVAGHSSDIAEVSNMGPDSKAQKTAEDHRRALAESRTRAVDALQVKLFAKALVNLGLPQYSPFASDRSRST
jgi:hypothetical protein